MKSLANILLPLALLSAVGCGSDGPELAYVEGTVTHNGKPLVDHLVEFNPQIAGGTTSLSRTDADGKYSLQFTRDKPGATPGDHVVRVLDLGGGKSAEIPEQYYEFDSPLAVTVEKGSNNINLTLEGN